MPFGFRNLVPLNIPAIRIFKQTLTSLLLLNSCVFAMSSSLLKDTMESSFGTELPAEGQAGSAGARSTFITIRRHRQGDKSLWGGNRENRAEQLSVLPKLCDVTSSHSLSVLIRTGLHKASSTSCLWVSVDLCQGSALPSWYGHDRVKNWFWFLPCLGLKPCRTNVGSEAVPPKLEPGLIRFCHPLSCKCRITVQEGKWNASESRTHNYHSW